MIKFFIYLKDNDIPLEFKFQLDKNSTFNIELGRVKEILIQASTIEAKARLEQFYNEIRTQDTDNIKKMVIQFSQDYIYTFEIPVKQILYRAHVDYMAGRKLLLVDNLSVRFEEDNHFYMDEENQVFLCDKNKCNYYTVGHCLKYKIDLDENFYNNTCIICKNCFLESSGHLEKSIKRDTYLNMQKRFFNK